MKKDMVVFLACVSFILPALAAPDQWESLANSDALKGLRFRVDTGQTNTYQFELAALRNALEKAGVTEKIEMEVLLDNEQAIPLGSYKPTMNLEGSPQVRFSTIPDLLQVATNPIPLPMPADIPGPMPKPQEKAAPVHRKGVIPQPLPIPARSEIPLPNPAKLIIKDAGGQIRLSIDTRLFLVRLIKIEGPAKLAQPDISGTWNSNIGLVYEFTQNGDQFTWFVALNNQKGGGTLSCLNLSASWSDEGGSGSAAGRITAFDANARAVRIEWENGVIFYR